MGKRYLFISLLMMVITLTGCFSQTITNNDEINTNSDTISSEDTRLTQARAEFFSNINSSNNNSDSTEAPPENWGIDDNIIALAYEAENTGDSTNLENYLKEHGLYERFLEITQKYNLNSTSIVKMATTPSPASVLSSMSKFKDGDIFLAYGGTGSSSVYILRFITSGKWKHAGLLELNAYNGKPCVISASSDTLQGFCVGYELLKKWTGVTGISVRRVRSRTDINARAAISYIKRFFCRPYSFTVTRTDDTKWYCSKVVYRAWLSQKINLEPTPSYYDRWVTPQDLANSSQTTHIAGEL